MKKMFCGLLSMILAATMSMSAFAVPSSADKSLDSKTMKLLEKNNVNANDITIVDEKSVFTKDELKKMEEEDLLLEKQGLKKESVIYFTYNYADSKNTALQQETNANTVSATATVQTREISAIRQYNTDTETISNTSHGMSYWLDMAINLTIGSYTKYIWKAYTILGLSTSSFLTTYHSGDLLTSHYQEVYTDKITQALNSRDNTWYSVVRRSKVVVKNYVDLYTVDKNNNPVRKSSTDTFTGYSQHYSDTTSNLNWVYNEACANVSFCGMTITHDEF